MCEHRERKQAIDPDTKLPLGHMVCMSCGQPCESKVPAGPGRCSACGRSAPQVPITQVRVGMGSTPEGQPSSVITVSRCPSCMPRMGAPPPPTAPAGPVVRMNGQ